MPNLLTVTELKILYRAVAEFGPGLVVSECRPEEQASGTKHILTRMIKECIGIYYRLPIFPGALLHPTLTGFKFQCAAATYSSRQISLSIIFYLSSK